MGLNGSPELPGDSDSSPLRTDGTHIMNYGPNTSDESDIEEENSHEGYVPLPLGDFCNEEVDNSIGIPQPDENLPTITNSDIEIEREVWSQPRPIELGIQLDTGRAQEIMSAMANITLPNAAIPQWAQGVPEELWKQDLLERIRQRKETNSDNLR